MEPKFKAICFLPIHGLKAGVWYKLHRYLGNEINFASSCFPENRGNRN